MICLIVAGKLFHTCGSATAKLLSPRVVHVRGTASVLSTSVLLTKSIGVPDMQSGTPLVSVLAAMELA